MSSRHFFLNHERKSQQVAGTFLKPYASKPSPPNYDAPLLTTNAKRCSELRWGKPQAMRLWRKNYSNIIQEH